MGIILNFDKLNPFHLVIFNNEELLFLIGYPSNISVSTNLEFTYAFTNLP